MTNPGVADCGIEIGEWLDVLDYMLSLCAILLKPQCGFFLFFSARWVGHRSSKSTALYLIPEKREGIHSYTCISASPGSMPPKEGRGRGGGGEGCCDWLQVSFKFGMSVVNGKCL